MASDLSKRYASKSALGATHATDVGVVQLVLGHIVLAMRAVGVLSRTVKPKPSSAMGADPLIGPFDSGVNETAGASNEKLPKPVPAILAIVTPVD